MMIRTLLIATAALALAGGAAGEPVMLECPMSQFGSEIEHPTDFTFRLWFDADAETLWGIRSAGGHSRADMIDLCQGGTGFDRQCYLLPDKLVWVSSSIGPDGGRPEIIETLFIDRSDGLAEYDIAVMGRNAPIDFIGTCKADGKAF